MMARRLVQLYVGLWCYGFACALFVRSGLGLDPWDVLHQGISDRVGLEIGTITIIMSGVVLLFWIPLKQWPGLGTISNALLVGLSVNLSLDVLPVHAPLWVRWIELLGGVVLLGAATGMYIGARFGPGPRDGLMTGLARRTGRSIRLVRTGIELTVLVIGFCLGGTVGVGTVLFAVCIGPVTQFFLPRFEIRAKGATDSDDSGEPDHPQDSVESDAQSSSSSRASQVASRSTAVSNSGC